QPAGQLGGQLQLGAERPGVRLGQPGDVLGADVQERVQRQGQGGPEGVGGQPGEGDPDVAVDELLAGRGGGGGVVDAGALRTRPGAGRRRVVDAEQQPVAFGLRQQRPAGPAQQPRGAAVGAAAGGPEGVVGGAELVGDAGGAEPGGDGAAAAGEEGAEQEGEQA